MGKSAIAAGVEIESRIVILRGQRVILDADLAELYGVLTKRLNEAVNRNKGRFPIDFMFRLTDEEFDFLRSQIATSRFRHGGRRYLPYAFTEHGAIQAANVLNSPQAIEVGLLVVRTFVKLRQMLAGHRELAGKLLQLERRVGAHDEQIAALIQAIRELMSPPPEKKRKPIGYSSEGD